MWRLSICGNAPSFVKYPELYFVLRDAAKCTLDRLQDVIVKGIALRGIDHDVRQS
jgi:hypothetical protein